MLFIASMMATKSSNLLPHHIKDLQARIRYAKGHPPEVKFETCHNKGPFMLDVIADAAMANKMQEAPREGYIIVRRYRDTVHPIFWNSRKLRRVARSSGTAETLAASDAVDFGIYLQKLLDEICYHHPMQLTTDSRILFNNITSTKKPQEVRNTIDLASLRESFSNGLLNAVCWTQGNFMLADALTKHNPTIASMLLRTLRSGQFAQHPENLYRISPKGGVEKDDSFGIIPEPSSN